MLTSMNFLKKFFFFILFPPLTPHPSPFLFLPSSPLLSFLLPRSLHPYLSSSPSSFTSYLLPLAPTTSTLTSYPLSIFSFLPSLLFLPSLPFSFSFYPLAISFLFLTLFFSLLTFYLKPRLPFLLFFFTLYL